MSSATNDQLNIDAAVIGLINAGKMVQTIGIEIDRYESQLRQSDGFMLDTERKLDYLKKEVSLEYKVQTEDSAVKMYSAALIMDCMKKIDSEETRLVSLLENARCLTTRIEGMKAQQDVYKERVLLAVAGWRAATSAADQNATMRHES